MRTLSRQTDRASLPASNDTEIPADDLMSLLLCVQDKSQRAQYTDQLIASGYLVTESGDGLTCLEHLRTNKFAALVTEINLLWGQGDGVIEVMTGDEAIETIPTVLLDFLQVSFSDDGEVRLSNPLSSEELVRVVDQRLARAQG